MDCTTFRKPGRIVRSGFCYRVAKKGRGSLGGRPGYDRSFLLGLDAEKGCVFYYKDKQEECNQGNIMKVFLGFLVQFQ
jgi:hypothetical protein